MPTKRILPLLLLPFVLLTVFLCLAVLLGGQDFVHALLNVAVRPVCAQSALIRRFRSIFALS